MNLKAKRFDRLLLLYSLYTSDNKQVQYTVYVIKQESTIWL